MTRGPLTPVRARRFRLVEKVGQSAIGDVYLAEHEADGGPETVVLKILNEDVARLVDVWQRMQEEAALLVGLGHPTIAAPRDHVLFDHRRALVMDPVEGADLEHVVAALELAGEPFPPRAALEVGAAVARALDAASTSLHDGVPLGLRHRDLRPGNVRITPSGLVRLVWFGIARGPDEPEATSAGLVGAEPYMAPERLLGTGDDSAGDVYGAAATLVELVIGRSLGRTPILPEAHARFVDDAIALLAPRLGGPPEAVGRVTEILRAALDVRPELRPSARELSTVLEDTAPALDGEDLRAFSARFLPTIDRVLARMRTPVVGAVAERVARPDATPWLDERTVAPLRSFRLHWSGTIAALVATAVLSTLFGAVAMFSLVRLHAAIGNGVATATLAPQIRPTSGTTEAPGPRTSDAPAPAARAPTRLPPFPAPAAPSARPGPTVERALFVVRDAAEVRVRCGDVRAVGAGTVRVQSFPVGSCTILATNAAGRTVEGTVVVDGSQRVVCEMDGDTLRCASSN